MSSTEIKIQSYDDLKQYFHPERRSMIHCAVQRENGFLPHYRHHYIVLGHTWSPEDGCQIIHYTSHATHNWKGIVSLEKYSNEKIEDDIKAGLYVYENCKYPQSETEYSVAFTRFEKRNNEKNYSIKFNNCEHLVYYILTGTPVSLQVKNATPFFSCLFGIIDRRRFYYYLYLFGTCLYAKIYRWRLHFSLNMQPETKTIEITNIDYLHKRIVLSTLDLISFRIHRVTVKSNCNVIVTQPFINYLGRRCKPSLLIAEKSLKDPVRTALFEYRLFVMCIPMLVVWGFEFCTTCYSACKSLVALAKRILRYPIHKKLKKIFSIQGVPSGKSFSIP